MILEAGITLIDTVKDNEASELLCLTTFSA